MRAVNLVPAEQRSGASVGVGRSEGGAYAVLALVAGLAVLALLYGMASHDVAARRTQAAAATAKAQQVESEAERLAPYTSYIALREQRAQAVEAVVDSRFDWAHLFHELGRVVPYGAVSISSLTGSVGTPGVATTAAASAKKGASATPPGSVPTFTLEGCAIGQGAVALTLERLHLIDGVSEVTLQSSTAATSGGGGASGGGCPAHDPSFTVALSFDPLPSTTAVASATKNVSNKGAGSAGASTSGGGSSR